MLERGEELLCPVYCVYQAFGGGVLPFGGSMPGYISYTSYGRLLFARLDILKNSRAAYPISDAAVLKIKKVFLGQYSGCAKFSAANGKRKAEFIFRFSPKVLGCKLPNQENNAHELVEIITKYERL